MWFTAITTATKKIECRTPNTTAVAAAANSMDSNETGHNLKCENHRNEFLVLNKFSNLRNASGDTVCIRTRMHNMLVSSGNDYMYHLRLKSQRCRCAQVHHYYLAINLSVHSFAHSPIHLRRVQRNATERVPMPFGDIEWGKFSHSTTCNVQSGPGCFCPIDWKYVEI